MTANEVIHHHKMNDKIQQRTVSCIYLSIHSIFWVIKDGLHSVDGAYKNLCVRYFSGPAWDYSRKSEKHQTKTSVRYGNIHRARPPMTDVASWNSTFSPVCLYSPDTYARAARERINFLSLLPSILLLVCTGSWLRGWYR